MSPVVRPFPASSRSLRAVVLSPHRLVSLTLGAAGRRDRSFSVVDSAPDADSALHLVGQHSPDVLVFDPTVLTPMQVEGWLLQVSQSLVQPNAFVLLLEPAQPWSTFAAEFAREAGVRCAITSQDEPEYWGPALRAAARGASYASPKATELFDLHARAAGPAKVTRIYREDPHARSPAWACA